MMFACEGEVLVKHADAGFRPPPDASRIPDAAGADARPEDVGFVDAETDAGPAPDSGPDCPEEICNGRDDDCDGRIDEELGCAVVPIACPVYPDEFACPDETGAVAFTDDVQVPFSGGVSSQSGAAVTGPDGRAAFLYATASEEFLVVLDASGAPSMPHGITEWNPELDPEMMGDEWPPFHRPRFAYDGTGFGVVRRTRTSTLGSTYFYRLDERGLRTAGPLRIDPPFASETPSFSMRAAVGWDGARYFVVFGARDTNGDYKVVMSAVRPDATIDTTWAANGQLVIDSPMFGNNNAQIAINDDATMASVVWGNSNHGVALVNLTEGRLHAQNACIGLETSGGGPIEVAWNEALGEFGIALFAQGPMDGMRRLQSVMYRLSLEADSSPALPLHCGRWLGAQFGGGLAVKPNGNWVVNASLVQDNPNTLREVIMKEIDASDAIISTVLATDVGGSSLSDLAVHDDRGCVIATVQGQVRIFCE